MRQMLLQNAIAILLQNATSFLLQNATVLLQIATVITKCDNFITKWDICYKMRRLLHIARVRTRKKITKIFKDVRFSTDT